MKCWRCGRELVTVDGYERLCDLCREEISATRAMCVDHTTEDDPLLRRSEVKALIDEKLREFANNPLAYQGNGGMRILCTDDNSSHALPPGTLHGTTGQSGRSGVR